MEWFQVEFPQEISPVAEPNPLIREAQMIYEGANCPNGFTVFQEIKSDGSLFLYFSPVARVHCLPLFDSYRGITCDEPVRSDKPIIWVAGDSTFELPWQ